MTKTETRYARVTSSLTLTARAVAAYLPENYRLASDELDRFVGCDGAIFIEGEDEAGWTLTDYVIPRLASGGYIAVEQFVHMEDDGDGESGPHLSVWLEDFPMGEVTRLTGREFFAQRKAERNRRAAAVDVLVRRGDPTQEAPERERCVICGESVPSSEMAEMHDASMLSDPEMFSEAEAGIVHAECGIAKGWQVS